MLLILGGTGEARGLAAAVAGRDDLRVISSLAGRVARPLLPVGETRSGGFGGVAGLIDWLTAHHPVAVVDATHPFAAGITANAAAACRQTSIPLLRLQRPSWPAAPHWTVVESVTSAAKTLPGLGERPFLTTGRGGLEQFVHRPVTALVRCVDPPSMELPPGWALILDRGPYRVSGEQHLMRDHAIDVLVTKNSGGDLTRAKLIAAAELGVPVLVIDRPPLPRGMEVVSSVEAAVAWVVERV